MDSCQTPLDAPLAAMQNVTFNILLDNFENQTKNEKKIYHLIKYLFNSCRLPNTQ